MTAPRPLFSIVIPTINRNAVLALTLDRFAPGAQIGMTLAGTGPADGHSADGGAATYEVIVADASQTGGAAGLLESRYPWARWVASAGNGPGANRNRGASVATGEWLLFVDDDCIAEERLLRTYFECQQQHALDVMEGCIRTRGHVDSPFRHQPSNVWGGFFWTGNLAIRRDVFESCGRFDEDYVLALEDMDLAFRITTRGMRWIFCRDAVVWHPSMQITLRDILRRRSMIRWHLLYRLKTGSSPPLGTSTPIVLTKLAVTQFVNELRTTWHLFSRPDPDFWRTKWFMQVLSWVTFPVLLPYLMYWELHFRRLLQARQPPSGSGASAA